MLPEEIITKLCDAGVIFGINATNIFTQAAKEPESTSAELLQSSIVIEKERLLNLNAFCLAFGGAPKTLTSRMARGLPTLYIKDGIFEVCGYGQPFREFIMQCKIGLEYVKDVGMNGSWLVITTVSGRITFEIPSTRVYEAQ